MNTKRTKIAFLIRSLEYGGAERQLLTLVKGMDKMQFEIAIIYFYGGGKLENELQDSPVRMVCLEKRNRWDILKFFYTLFRYLQQFQPDLLHSYLSTSNLIAVCLKPFFPKMRIIWGVRASNLEWSNYDWFARFNFQLECILSKFADYIIVNSQTGKDYHLRHRFPENKMTVIPNGIDTNQFHPDAKAREQIRLEWRVDNKTILIGLVGRLDPIKDHYTFFQAAKLLFEQQEDIRVICIGSGETTYQQKLQVFVEELGIAEKVIWPGMRNDMPSVYNGLDILTSCSLSEGFSNAIAEAMSCGVACVVTDVGDSTWIVGDTGITIPVKHPEKLCQAWLTRIAKIQGTGNLSQSEQPRQRIVNNFSITRLVDSTQSYLELLVNAERDFLI